MEITDLQKDLAATFRWAARLNMNEAVANHFSAWVPGSNTDFYVNRSGIHFSQMKASDLILVTKDNIDDLKNRLAKLFEFIDIDNKRTECEKLEIETQKDSFWQNQNEAKKTLKKLNDIKKWIDEFDEISIDIEELNILLELNASDEEILSIYKKTIS